MKLIVPERLISSLYDLLVSLNIKLGETKSCGDGNMEASVYVCGEDFSTAKVLLEEAGIKVTSF